MSGSSDAQLRRGISLHSMVEFAGHFRVRDALAQGVSYGQLRAQHLSAPFHGVRSVLPPSDDIARCRAYATKMREDAAFCGISAARIWGIPLPASLHDERVHVSTPHGGPRPTGRGVRGQQHDPGRFATVVVDGLRVFSPVATWLSLGRMLALPDLVAAADFLVTQRFGSREPALATLEDLRGAARTRIPGKPTLLRAAGWAAVGPLSRPESLCRILMLSSGIPAGIPNLRVSPLVMFDLGWPDVRVGFDYLGDVHRSPTQFARDVERRNVVRETGWRMLEATRADLFEHPHQLVLRTAGLLSERGLSIRLAHPSKFVLPTR